MPSRVAGMVAFRSLPPLVSRPRQQDSRNDYEGLRFQLGARRAHGRCGNEPGQGALRRRGALRQRLARLLRAPPERHA